MFFRPDTGTRLKLFQWRGVPFFFHLGCARRRTHWALSRWYYTCGQTNNNEQLIATILSEDSYNFGMPLSLNSGWQMICCCAVQGGCWRFYKRISIDLEGNPRVLDQYLIDIRWIKHWQYQALLEDKKTEQYCCLYVTLITFLCVIFFFLN